MPVHSIENERLQLKVKQIGAEICSIKSLTTDKEYIWEGKPEIWVNHSPILFPVVGALKDGVYWYKGQGYTLPQHGFMQHNKKVELIEKTDKSLHFQLKSNDATKIVYPFDFEFNIRYELAENTIKINHEIINLLVEEMYFSVGAHPAFKCPVNDKENYYDYYLEFEQKEQAQSWQIAKEGLIGNKIFEVFNNTNIINLHHNLFDNGALVFKDLKSRKVSLKSRTSTQKITVYFDGFPYLGIWAKPNANFVCIEPWVGIADSVNADQNFITKEGIIKLNAEENFIVSYSIKIDE